MLAFKYRPSASRQRKPQWARCVAFVSFALVAAGAAGQSTAAADAPQADSLGAAWSAPEPWRTDRFYLQTSVYTVHFNPSPDHVNQQYLVDLEWRFDKFWAGGQWLAGAAIFKNSFGQPSQYLYGGWQVRPFVEAQPLYFKITAGVLHGYKPPYDDKIPFNDSGVAPAILPSVGYCYSRYCSELILFGTAGAMLTVGATLP
jgi:hypothetical protein